MSKIKMVNHMFHNKSSNNITTVFEDIFENTNNKIDCNNISTTIIIPHVCNNIGLFGAGFANAIRQKFPVVATNFELLGSKTKLGYVQYISVKKNQFNNNEMFFANMIAQNGIINKNNHRPLNYEALVKCMIDVRNFIRNSKQDNIEIHCPKFGSGLAGGNWVFINDLIRDIWKEISVTIYGYPKHKEYAKNY